MESLNVSKFFELRAQRLDTSNPLTAVMYQDTNPDLAIARDVYEKEYLIPKLKINKYSRILDYGCGTARLGAYLGLDVAEYIGIDPSPHFIEYATRELSELGNVKLICGGVEVLRTVTNAPNIIIIGGVTQYMEHQALEELLKEINRFFENSKEELTLYLRTSVSRGEGFELNNVWSEELNSHYSAIYRSVEDMEYQINSQLRKCFVSESGEAFPSRLGNRVETTQFFWVIKSE
jgi:ubiquinone/menaquinone biosynthesis C-methylase UbiE